MLIKELFITSGIAAAIAFLIAALVGPVLIPFLHRLKFGQEIREEGPSWHQKKSGTPTMGGIIFILGACVAALICARDNAMYSVLLCSLCFGIVGFADDFIKVILKRNLGLRSLQKLVLQIAVSVVFVVVIYRSGMIDSKLILPFTDWQLPLGIFYIPAAVFIMVGFTNAVNLTDGLDGLAASVTAVVCLFIAVAAYLKGQLTLCVFSVALFGGLLGFLLYNRHPAKVFMGDTGSLFLGGFVSAAAILLKMPVIFVLAGFIYVAEDLSVVLQVASFKLTGKRIFKMSPIHHHYEMCGLKETQIVFRFCAVTVLCCIVAVLSIL
ncbi:MAG: phospho-N-acetylmuramoyl-pentapeptide-transferase [Clostridia bacterium]|nr:phospho-N-acetylmuramoyl-pentapeptide-transferase [Clostridia bacterium]